MAMADGPMLVDAEASSLGGGVMPAGDATEFGRMKSSRFIGSAGCMLEWSTELRN